MSRGLGAGLLAWVGVAALGCAASSAGVVLPVAPEPLEGPCAELYQEGMGPEALGFALAWLAPDVPRELDALASWVDGYRGPASIPVDPPIQVDLTGVAGEARCQGLDSTRFLVEGQPPRLRGARVGRVATEKERTGRDHFAAGRFPEGRAAWSVAATHAPLSVPAPGLAVAASYAEEGRWREALALYRALAEQFPWNAEAYAGVGRSLRALLRRLDAVEASARALALRPGSGVVRAFLASDAFAEVQPPVAPPAARARPSTDGSESIRWVQLAAPERDPANPQVIAEASAYASCKEAFRSSPELREAATGRPLPQWLWTPAEESVCAGLWLRTYLQNRALGRAADSGLDDLMAIAREGFLDERALFDVGGWVHLAAPLLLEPDRRTRLFTFVERHRASPRRDTGWMFP